MNGRVGFASGLVGFASGRVRSLQGWNFLKLFWGQARKIEPQVGFLNFKSLNRYKFCADLNN